MLRLGVSAFTALCSVALLYEMSSKQKCDYGIALKEQKIQVHEACEWLLSGEFSELQPRHADSVRPQGRVTMKARMHS